MLTTTIVIFVIAAVIYYLTKSPSSLADHNIVLHEHCSRPKYFLETSSYKSNVNLLLSSFINSSSVSTYNNFTIDGIDSNPKDNVHGLYQCRGDLSYGSDNCVSCVSQAVSRLSSYCAGARAGTIQLEGCIVRYDTVAIIGEPDKTLIVNCCEVPYQYKPDEVGRTNALLRFLVASFGSSYRTERSKEAEAVAQCTDDLSAIDCQDCLIEAILWQNPLCGKTGWGEVYLGKCYVRYSSPGASGYEYKKRFGSVRRQIGDESKSLFYRGQDFIVYIIMALFFCLKHIIMALLTFVACVFLCCLMLPYLVKLLIKIMNE